VTSTPPPKLICATDAEKDNWQENGVPVDRFVHTCFNDTVADSKDSDFVPKLNGTYNFNEDKMIYFTYSEGFRRGGVNSAKQDTLAEAGDLHTYNPDNNKNYEIGVQGHAPQMAGYRSKLPSIICSGMIFKY